SGSGASHLSRRAAAACARGSQARRRYLQDARQRRLRQFPDLSGRERRRVVGLKGEIPPLIARDEIIARPLSRRQRPTELRASAPVESQETFRFSAEVFPRFSTRSYSTTWFSLRVESPARSTAEIWTNTSRSPPFGLMNP